MVAGDEAAGEEAAFAGDQQVGAPPFDRFLQFTDRRLGGAENNPGGPFEVGGLLGAEVGGTNAVPGVPGERVVDDAEMRHACRALYSVSAAISTSTISSGRCVVWKRRRIHRWVEEPVDRAARCLRDTPEHLCPGSVDRLLELDEVLAADPSAELAELVVGHDRPVRSGGLAGALDPGRDELAGGETDALLDLFVADHVHHSSVYTLRNATCQVFAPSVLQTGTSRYVA